MAERPGVYRTAVPTAVAARPRRPTGGAHRLPSPPPALRGRIVVAAVAVGAAAAAAAVHQSHTDHLAAGGVRDTADAAAAMGMGGNPPASPEVLLMSHSTATPASQEVAKLTASGHALAAKAAAEAEARRPKFMLPTHGTFTSGFGGRWGSFHYGIDIANAIGTPIVAAADGVIIEAGPAHGFGLWVREQLADGTILVYGHMHSYSVNVGQHVQAGDQIARMGSRGESTGPHLHFEVWNPAGQKIDPAAWLARHGIHVN